VGKAQKNINSEVKKFALKNSVKILQPNNSKELYQSLISKEIDLIVTFAYGSIIKKEVLDIPKLGSINIHTSLLPKYRGADPITWAILNGEDKTGITIMEMNEFMDEGDIILSEETVIEKDDNYETLYNKLSNQAVPMLNKVLNDFKNNYIMKVPQQHNLATYTRKITREDEHISFNDNVFNIHNKIRALYPKAYININGIEVKILKTNYELKSNTKVGKVSLTKNDFTVEGKDGIINLLIVKPFSKKEMEIKSYLNGLNKENVIIS
jgi:methionyl-tRNA formyltransferase